jgi:hypothetical protein
LERDDPRDGYDEDYERDCERDRRAEQRATTQSPPVPHGLAARFYPSPEVGEPVTFGEIRRRPEYGGARLLYARTSESMAGALAALSGVDWTPAKTQNVAQRLAIAAALEIEGVTHG